MFLVSVEALLWKIITFIWMCMNFMKCFYENAHVLLWNEKALFGICQRDVKTENTVPFLGRNFTLKDNHVHLKVYEFHEMLMWETHMCYSEMRSICLGYFKVLLKWEQCSCSVEALLWKIITFFSMCISWNAFVWNEHVFLWKDKPFFGICQRLDKTKNSINFSLEVLLW